MARPQPITLWLSILGELVRLVALTTGVLVSVIAFATTIKPLADGTLDPIEAVKFMFLAMPPMLAYALPFAGCFASTLVYHRLSNDNEFAAAASGGVSHRALLLPAAVVGLALAVGLAALNEQVIPRFLSAMQRLVTEDLARILATNINRGQSVELKRLVIFADRAQPIEVDPASGASTALVLARPAVIERDDAGRVTSEGTASRATLWLFPQPSRADSGPTTRLAIRLEDFVSKDASTGLVSGRSLPLSLTLPSTLSDDPKFLTTGELLALRSRPERMGWIDQRRRALAREVVREELLRRFNRALETDGFFTLIDDADRQVVVRGRVLRPAGGTSWAVEPGSAQKVEVLLLRTEPGSPTRARGVRYAAASVVIAPDTSDAQVADELRLRIELRDLVSSVFGESEGGEATRRSSLSLAGLRMSDADRLALEPFAAKPALELLAAPQAQGSDGARQKASELTKDLADLRREVLSKQHERLAMAASCFVMLVTGAVTALRFSKSLPLTVYLWGFFPALFSVITISGGQQMTHGQGWIGLLMLWGGVAALMLYTGWTYMIVRRH